MLQAPYFHDKEALVNRLSSGLKKRPQQVVFLVGSPLSAPIRPGLPGVPGVNGVIELIRREFDDGASQLAAFNQAVIGARPSEYQGAFVFLQGRRGQQTANEIVRSAVLGAWVSTIPALDGLTLPELDDACRAMEFDTKGWALTPGTKALGQLAALYSDRFGRSLLTTNFDPLLEVSIRRAGGYYFRTTLHADGNLSQTEGDGCHVIHLHGYWFGSDTLHTTRQLSQERPRLLASLSTLLRNKLVVVCGYGGWDDAFTKALLEVVRDDTAFPEILWTFYTNTPVLDDTLSRRLTPGIDRGRITLYAGVDCNVLFPNLLRNWLELEPRGVAAPSTRSNPVHVTAALIEEIKSKPRQSGVLEGDDEDRPPLVDIYVGREQELAIIRTSPAKVIFLTGIGGQGKSTVAAKYYTDCQAPSTHFSYFVWRDCKEEGERFENQLASVVESLSGGTLNGKDLAQQTVDSIIHILISLIDNTNVLFIFDNVDHYVNIEYQRLIGSADLFVEALLKSGSRSRVIFTCRPAISYENLMILSMRLAGIDIDAAESLFVKRGASSTRDEIQAAHSLTEGHTFWLDLLAIQVAQKEPPGRNLTSLLAEIRSGGGPLPADTLNSIWSTLKKREQAVLRAMAETVKPETDVSIADYLGQQLTFNKVSKAIRALRSLNLIVIKRRPNGSDLLELHPLVRQFIRHSFSKADRVSYIDQIIQAYKRFIAKNRSGLQKRPALSLLEYWTQNAELDISVGNFDDAFATLQEVAVAFETSGYARELVRVARLLLSSIDWASEFKKYAAFESVFRSHVESLSYLGETKEVDELLDQYAVTVPDRDVRYINYCAMRSGAYWVRNDFVTAMTWAKTGVELKNSSDVDSRFANRVEYALALAERDAGYPESALPIFLLGRPLAEVVNPQELDEARDEGHYGNVGRCLHFMGQIESALVCYQKSALLIERNPKREHVLNQGYIRTWIGELLASREEFKLAYAFLHEAERRWRLVAPPKVASVLSSMEQIIFRHGEPIQISDEVAERLCLDWILGHL